MPLIQKTVELSSKLSKVDKSLRDELKREIGELIVDESLLAISKGNSPVAKIGKFQKLNKEYKKEKIKEGGRGIANLELDGDMLENFGFEISKTGTLKVGIFGPQKEQDKADGHCNFSGKSKLPNRRFVPKKDETFNKNITSKVNDLISEYEEKSMEIKAEKAKDSTEKTIATSSLLSQIINEITGNNEN